MNENLEKEDVIYPVFLLEYRVLPYTISLTEDHVTNIVAYWYKLISRTIRGTEFE